MLGNCVLYLCISYEPVNYAIIGSRNGLPPVGLQAIVCINIGLSLLGSNSRM